MFFILPVGVDYSARRYPVVTFTIIGLNILIFLPAWGQMISGSAAQNDNWWYYYLWLFPAYSPWYCYITAVFAHAGLLHLLGNMVYLFLFGSPVEDMMGRWQYLLFYLLSGVISNFTYIAFIPEHFSSEVKAM